MRRLLRRTGALLLATHCAMGWADAAADQRERALLNRALQEARPSPAENAASLPGASIPVPAKQEATAPRRRVLEEKQWRSLLSGQQMHRFGPESQAGAQSQWRAQNLERERRAEDLSADILQRSRSYLSNDRR